MKFETGRSEIGNPSREIVDRNCDNVDFKNFIFSHFFAVSVVVAVVDHV